MPNADNAREFVDQISDLWRKRRTFKGLLGLLIVTNSLVLVAAGFTYFALGKCGILSSYTHYINYFVICLISFSVLNLLSFFIWAYWRTLPICSSDMIEILFSPSADGDASDLVYKLYDNIRNDLSSRSLNKRISCRHLPEHTVIKNSEEAIDILAKSGARLLIYGTMRSGNIKGDKVEGFKSISFTVNHRPLPPEQQNAVLKDLASALAFRTFCSHESNSFIEYDVVIKNISEVSRFFIALGLTLDGEIEESIGLLEKLLGEQESLPNQSPSKHKRMAFISAITSCLTVALQAKFTRSYEANLIDNITNRSYDVAASECSKILNKLLSLNKQTADYYLCLAIIEFHYGNIESAIQAVKHAQRLSSFDNASPHLSMAFLYLWVKQYRKAFMEYMRAGKCKNHSIQTVTSVLSFLHSMRQQYPERYELKFATAFVNDRFFDKEIALRDYQSFLGSNPETALSDFLKFAERQIQKLGPTTEIQ